MTEHTAEKDVPEPILAVGNNEPLPEGLPDALVTILRESRTRAGWCEHGKRLDEHQCVIPPGKGNLF